MAAGPASLLCRADCMGTLPLLLAGGHLIDCSSSEASCVACQGLPPCLSKILQTQCRFFDSRFCMNNLLFCSCIRLKDCVTAPIRKEPGLPRAFKTGTGYRKSCNTPCGRTPAWASMAVELSVRICFVVSLTTSSAMSASRIRDSEA